MSRREFLALLGSSVAWPLAAQAQRPTIPVVGLLHSLSPQGLGAASKSAFLDGLAAGGFTAGRDVAIEYRWAQGHFDRLPALANDLSSSGSA